MSSTNPDLPHKQSKASPQSSLSKEDRQELTNLTFTAKVEYKFFENLLDAFCSKSEIKKITDSYKIPASILWKAINLIRDEKIALAPPCSAKDDTEIAEVLKLAHLDHAVLVNCDGKFLLYRKDKIIELKERDLDLTKPALKPSYTDDKQSPAYFYLKINPKAALELYTYAESILSLKYEISCKSFANACRKATETNLTALINENFQTQREFVTFAIDQAKLTDQEILIVHRYNIPRIPVYTCALVTKDSKVKDIVRELNAENGITAGYRALVENEKEILNFLNTFEPLRDLLRKDDDFRRCFNECNQLVDEILLVAEDELTGKEAYLLKWIDEYTQALRSFIEKIRELPQNFFSELPNIDDLPFIFSYKTSIFFQPLCRSAAITQMFIEHGFEILLACESDLYPAEAIKMAKKANALQTVIAQYLIAPLLIEINDTSNLIHGGNLFYPYQEILVEIKTKKN